MVPSPADKTDLLIIYLTVIVGSHTCFRFAFPGEWSWAVTSWSHFMHLAGRSVSNCRVFVQHADPSSTGLVKHALVYSCAELLEAVFFFFQNIYLRHLQGL